MFSLQLVSEPLSAGELYPWCFVLDEKNEMGGELTAVFPNLIHYRVKMNTWPEQKSQHGIKRAEKVELGFVSGHKLKKSTNSVLSKLLNIFCRGGNTVWGLRIVEAAPLPWWLSTAPCSHALSGKPDPNIYRHTHMCSHTEEQEVQRRLNLKMCVVRLEAHMPLWREGGPGSVRVWGGDEAGSWDIERQVDGPTDTDWLSPLRAVHWQVEASVKNCVTHV